MKRSPIPRGVKQVRAKLAGGARRTYWYHRASGKRIQAEPGTAAALIEVQKLDAKRARADQAEALAHKRSLRALWNQYHASPEFTGLKPRTRSDYEAVFTWLGTAADAATPASMTSGEVLALRDRAFRQKGRRFANYVVQVVRLVLEWGRPHKWLLGNPEANPARGVKLIKKPKGERDLNRAWKDQEVWAFLAKAPPRLRIAFALGLFACMREGDVIRIRWASYDGATLLWKAGKNDEECNAPVTGVLKQLLDANRAEHPAEATICLTSYGKPWKSESSFRSAFFGMVKELRDAGDIGPGATFHGLRHTVGTAARAGGESEFRVAAALGDRSTAMAGIYGRNASRQDAQSEVLGRVQDRFHGSAEGGRQKIMENGLENGSAGAPVGDGKAEEIQQDSMEAWPGFEPGCTDLQSAA